MKNAARAVARAALFVGRSIKKRGLCQIIGMRKIKNEPLNRTREERESCFPAGRTEELRGEKE